MTYKIRFKPSEHNFSLMILTNLCYMNNTVFQKVSIVKDVIQNTVEGINLSEITDSSQL
jgi:hypothetical protein